MMENKSETKSPKETKTTPTVRIVELLERLGEPLPEEAVQRTKKEKTHKSYDTDGYGYQYCVDRFNDVLGEKWGFTWEILKEIQGKYSQSGKSFFDITAKVSIWVNNEQNSRAAVGGHIALLYADALKGAITNAFKKTAAFWGVGRQAYLGLLDDDNKPLPEEAANGKQQSKTPHPKQFQPPPLSDNKTEAKYKNEVAIMPMFLAYQSFPDGSIEYLNYTAKEIYTKAGAFQMKNKDTDELMYDKKDNPIMKEPPMDLQKLSIGWAKKIHHVLKDKILAQNLTLDDALTWWDALGSKASQYSWWKVEVFKETVQSPF